jgi:hypothetical protein
MADDKDIIFEVKDNGFQRFIIQFYLPDCASLYTIYYPELQHFITGTNFSLTTADLTINGTFSTDSSASGTLEITSDICEGVVNTTWSASKSDLIIETPTPAPGIEALMPEAKLSDGVFLPAAGISSYSPSTFVIHDYSKGDWGLAVSSMAETIVPVPIGWTVIETLSGVTHLRFSPDGNLEEPPINIVLSSRGHEGDLKTSTEVIAEFEAELSDMPNLTILRKEIVDSDKGYIFTTVESSPGRKRYLLVLVSKDPKGWFHIMAASTDQEDWNDYYPIIQAIAEKWATYDGHPIGMTLPATLVE